jgi:hypothetical protein
MSAEINFFLGPPNPRDVRAKLLGWEQRHSEEWVARVWIEDGTEDEGVEVVLAVSRTLRSTHPLDDESVESAVANYMNLKWPAEYRLVAERSRSELGGEYALGGDAEVGLHLVELSIPVPA